MPTPRPQTLESRTRPRTPQTHPLSGPELLRIRTAWKPRPAVTTLREDEAAGNNSDVDVDQQLLRKLACGDSLPDDPRPELWPDAFTGEEQTSLCIAEGAMAFALGLGLGSCLVHFLGSNVFISGSDHYTHREVFGLLRDYVIYEFCIGFILFIVLWDIVHAAFLQLLVCKEPPFDGVEA